MQLYNYNKMPIVYLAIHLATKCEIFIACSKLSREKQTVCYAQEGD